MKKTPREEIELMHSRLRALQPLVNSEHQIRKDELEFWNCLETFSNRPISYNDLWSLTNFSKANKKSSFDVWDKLPRYQYWTAKDQGY